MNNIGISLGLICKSAVWGVENNYRSNKDNDYKTCPFDLMVSNYKGVIDCIYTDFHYFCHPDHITLIHETNLIVNTKYNFGFNHESPDHAGLYLSENWPEGNFHFVNNNFKHFIDRYQRRIQSFINYLNDPNNYIIFIIQFHYDVNPNDDLFELRTALAIKYPYLKYEIKVI